MMARRTAVDTAGNAVDRQRRGRDQPADEAAARFIMAAQQHEDRKEQHQGCKERRHGAED